MASISLEPFPGSAIPSVPNSTCPVCQTGAVRSHTDRDGSLVRVTYWCPEHVWMTVWSVAA